MKKNSLLSFLILMLTLCGCSNISNPSESSSSLLSEEESSSESGSSAISEEESSSESSSLDIWNQEYTYKLQCADSYSEEYTYSNYRLYADEKEIPIFNCKTNFSNTWHGEAPQRMNNGVAIFQLEGTVKLKLVTDFKVNNKCSISPKEENIPYHLEEKQVEFIISNPGQYTIELSNSRTLHLFVNSLNQYESFRSNSNVLYFGAGVHNRENDSRIDGNNYINLSSNTTVFIDEGAIIEGGFRANNKSNITLCGYGIVTGAKFKRNALTGEVFVPYDFNNCDALKFYGISTLDPAGWCYNLYFSKNIDISNIKIISSRSNGDGISIQSCQNVTCSSSFVRSWDDALVVKNYPLWSNRNIEGTTKNIHFKDCIIWNDLAQSMEIGYETVGQVMEDISFEDIIVIHNFRKAVISIHNGNNANIKNVKFKNITVEDASMGKGDGKNVLIELTCEFSSTWSSQHKVTSLGSIDGVIIENVKVLSSKHPLISIRGSIDSRPEYQNSTHYISNVTIRNLSIEGQKIDKSYDNYEERYASNIVFE